MSSFAIEMPATPAPTMQMSACNVACGAMSLASVNTQRPAIFERGGNPGAMLLQPGPEHEHRPKVIRAIALSGQMFAPLHLDRIRIQQPFLPDGAGVQQVFGPLPQGAPEPGAQRQMESHLRPLIQRLGNMPVQYPAQDVLSRLTTHLQIT